MTNLFKIPSPSFFKSLPPAPSRPILCAALLAAAGAFSAVRPASAQALQTAPPPRITSPIDNSVRSTLPGSRSPQLASLTDIGAVAPSTPVSGITLVFNHSAAQQADLQTLLAAQQNPASPLFHQWLTPAQFGVRFGVADSDLAAAKAWLQQQGFTLGAVSNSRDRITFSGTAAQVEAAFGAPIHTFRGTSLDASGAPVTHIAPATDISLPAALAASVLTVGHLSDFRPRSHAVLKNAQPHFTSATTGNHFLTPGDVSTIYDIKPAYNSGYTGAGQTIVVIGQSAVITTDVTTFQTAAGVPVRAPALLLVTGSGSSAIHTGDEAESDLDLEYTSAIATSANIVFVYTGNTSGYGAFDSIQYAVDNKIGNIISSSYGVCETALTAQGFGELENLFAQAATQGQTVISAAGDAGSTDCYGTTTLSTAAQETPSVDYPASSSLVTAMGGTEFPAASVAAGNSTYFAVTSGSDVISSALSYIPEQVWNDDSSTTGLSSGGGGVSAFALRPPWQAAISGIAASTYRTLPDISLDSSPNNAGYAYCSSDTTALATGQTASCSNGFRDATSGDLTLAGGTSFAAPIFSGMLALINQAKAPSGQGLVSPTLYALASNSTTYSTAFHDITSGGNQCTAGSSYCSAAGVANYAAGTGYDLATGLGSIDLNMLLTAWPKAVASTTSFSIAAAATSVTPGTNGTTTAMLTPTGGYTGTVYFSLSSLNVNLSNACYLVANATITGTAAVMATITISTNTPTCGSGAAPLIVHNTGAAVASNPIQAPSPWKQAPLPATLASLLLAVCFTRRSRRLRGLTLSLAGLLALGAVVGLSGCSSSAASTAPTTTTTTTTTSSGTTTPAGSYPITVVGVDSKNSAVTAATTFTLTVI